MIASFRLIAGAVALLALSGASVLAQDFPTKVVRIVVPVAPGGVTDTLARLVAQGLTERWGQQVIVENRPGGGGQIGAEMVLRAPPDGHTLLVGADTSFVVRQYLYKMNYDPLQDFVPVTGLGGSPQTLVVHPSVQAKSVAELLEHGKAKPGDLNYGTFGVGSNSHLNIERLGMLTGARFTPVHYRGAAPAITDLLGGHIQFMIVSTSLIAEAAKAGRLNLLAVGGKNRLKEFPNVPTLAETGLAGYETGAWFGLVAPKGTPSEIVLKISKDVQAIFNDDAFQQKFLAPTLLYSVASDPQIFADMMRREAEQWKKVIEQANVKVE